MLQRLRNFASTVKRLIPENRSGLICPFTYLLTYFRVWDKSSIFKVDMADPFGSVYPVFDYDDNDGVVQGKGASRALLDPFLPGSIVP